MAVVTKNEVQLNSIHYPIKGSPISALSNLFAPKMVVGDFSKESEREISSWIIGDQRGGILCEEMEERKDANRAFFSTCDLRFKGHIFLPPLATPIDLTSGAPTPDTETLRPSAAGDETNIKFSANGTATETLRPDADGSTTDLTPKGGGDNYVEVDEAAQDDETTYVYHATANTSVSDLYGIADHGGSGDVIQVVVYVRCKCLVGISGTNTAKTYIRTHSTNYSGTTNTLTEAQQLFSTTYTTNPNTGDPWTWAEVDALQAGVTLYMATAGTPMCTQVYVIVTYSANAHYTKVDEAVADDTDYVNELDGRTARDLYNIANSGVGAGTITAVTVYVRGKSSGDGSFKTALKTHGSVYEGDAETSAAYAVKNTEYINNPLTGDAWTWVEIDAIQAGVELVGVAYCSQVYIIVSYTAAATITNVPFANYNGKLYVGHGTKLQYLDDTGDGFTVKDTLPAVITDLVVSEDNSLYILMGATSYEYLDVGGTVNASDHGGLVKAVHWDDCLYGIDANGQMAYCVDPSAASPDWTNTCGKLEPESCGVVNSMIVSDDAAGAPIIYVGTTKGWFAHDKTNTCFWPTKLIPPEHPQSCKGVANWRGSVYVSSSLDVLKYTAGTTAYIESVGLNKEGGLPPEYRAQIVKLIEGYNEVYALLDSTLAPELSYSSIMVWTGTGWVCLWTAPTEGNRAFSGIVSPIYAYRVWWDWNDKAYYFDIARDLHNPLKITTQTFAASAFHITPWFDADGAASDKLAKSVSLDCDRMTANETVIVKYRIDHEETDLDTGWTTLGTITSDGETSYGFDTGGIVFKAIQFRFDLARVTTTNTPDIHWVKLRYIKLLPVMWSWQVRIDCTKEWRGRAPAQLVGLLKTALASQTLVSFTYLTPSGTATTQYVRAREMPRGVEYTGETPAGQFDVILSEVV